MLPFCCLELPFSPSFMLCFSHRPSYSMSSSYSPMCPSTVPSFLHVSSFRLLTNYTNFTAYNNTHLWSLSLVDQELSTAYLGPLYKSLKATIMVSTRLYSHPESWLGKNPLRVHPGWQSSFPCSARLKALVFAGCQLKATLQFLRCHL